MGRDKKKITWEWDGAKLRFFDDGNFVDSVRMDYIAECVAESLFAGEEYTLEKGGC